MGRRLCYGFLHHNKLPILQRPGCKHASSTILCQLDFGPLDKVDYICSLQEVQLVILERLWNFLPALVKHLLAQHIALKEWPIVPLSLLFELVHHLYFIS